MSTRDDIRVGELEVRPREHVVLVGGHEVTLTAREFDIILRLTEHPHWVLSAEDLAAEVNDDPECSPESVSVLISRLRQKLAAAGADDVVDTVRGVGYRLDPSISPAEEEPPAPGSPRCELHDALWDLSSSAVKVERTADDDGVREATLALIEARDRLDRIAEG